MTTSHLILYDGVCGLCHRGVQWVLPRDRREAFSFAPLQSRIARGLLTKHGHLGEGQALSFDTFDTFVFVEDFGLPTERTEVRSRGALRVLRHLGGAYRLLGAVLSLAPTVLGDAVYRYVSTRRYSWFGRADACLLPPQQSRSRFIGLNEVDEAA